MRDDITNSIQLGLIGYLFYLCKPIIIFIIVLTILSCIIDDDSDSSKKEKTEPKIYNDWDFGK